MRVLLGVLLVGSLSTLSAQVPISRHSASDVQLSPQDAYEHAIRPLEITRRAPQNWSDVELKALKVARENAKSECAARSPEKFTGANLVSLARLCAFALQWETVHWAASNYIATALDSKRVADSEDTADLATAFDYKIQSSLNLKNLDEAIGDCRTMVQHVPYGLFTSEATDGTIDAIRFTRTDDAIALLHQRQPMILSLIEEQKSSGSITLAAQPKGAGASPPLPLYSLYADAVALPVLQRFANQEKTAAESFAQLEAALPVNLSANDRLYIEQLRRQYLSVGKHLPSLNPMGSLLYAGAGSPQGINTMFGNGAIFLLFPDWCNQCIALGPDATEKNRELVATHKVRFFLLMAQSNPPEKPAPAPPLRNVPLSARAAKAAVEQGQQLHVDQQIKITSDPDKLLLGTPTVVVPNETLNTFAATDYPLIIATDHSGTVRWIGHAQGNALESNGEVDQIVRHILATWPPE